MGRPPKNPGDPADADLESVPTTDLDAMDPGAMKGVSVGGKFAKSKELIAQGYSCEFPLTMEEGMEVRGIFLGEGPIQMVNSRQNPGTKIPLKRWRVRVEGGMTLAILGSAGLDGRIGVLKPGQECVIQHHGKVKAGAGDANNFVVWPGKKIHSELEEVKATVAALAANGSTPQAPRA